MDPGNPEIYLILAGVCIIFYAIVQAAREAIVDLNDSLIRKKAEDEDAFSIKVTNLLKSPMKFTQRVMTAKLIYLIFGSAFLTMGARQYFEDRGEFLIALLIALIIYVVLFIVLAVNLPKKLGTLNPEKTAKLLFGIFKLLTAITLPLAVISGFIYKVILKIFKTPNKEVDENATEEEIMMLLDVGNEQGSIDETEREMIEGIFDFDDRMVDEIMTHRTEIISLEKTATIHEAIALIVKEGYSRMPVYDDDIDNIIGILYAKDLFKTFFDTDMQDKSVQSVMRSTIFVPESKKCTELFTQMQESKMQLAVVVDEYGGTSGIVTMEDVIETIVGNIQDEYDDEEEEYLKHSEDSYTFDGTVSLEDVEKILDITLPPQQDYETLAGLILDKLGKIPKVEDCEEIEIENWKISVVEMQERRISKAKAVKIESDENL